MRLTAFLYFLTLLIATPLLGDDLGLTGTELAAKSRKGRRKKTKSSQGMGLTKPLPRKVFHGGVRLGFHSYPLTGLGIEGNYALNPGLTLGGFYAVGKGDFRKEVPGSPNVSIDKFDIETALFFGYARIPLMKYLYASMGGGQRTVVGKYELTSKASNADRAYGKVIIGSLCVYGAIGTLWQFPSGLTIGADWIGYAHPLTSGKVLETTTEGVATEFVSELEAKVENEADKVAATGSLQLVMVNLGWAF